MEIYETIKKNEISVPADMKSYPTSPEYFNKQKRVKYGAIYNMIPSFCMETQNC